MTTQIALLRGINVGGHRKVAMADLRDLATRLDLKNPRTLLQSGNIVFRSSTRSSQQLERLLEAEAASRFGLQIDFMVRSSRDWEEAIAANPFPDHAKRDPSHLLVMFMKEAPSAGGVKALQAAIDGPELARVVGRHAYIVYPAGIGISRLTGALIEKTLGTRGTGRNWNTVQKLAVLAGEIAREAAC